MIFHLFIVKNLKIQNMEERKKSYLKPDLGLSLVSLIFYTFFSGFVPSAHLEYCQFLTQQRKWFPEGTKQESGLSEVALVVGNKANIQVFLGPQEIQTTHLICSAPSMLFTDDWLTVETKSLLYCIWSHNSHELKYKIPKEA